MRADKSKSINSNKQTLPTILTCVLCIGYKLPDTLNHSPLSIC